MRFKIRPLLEAIAPATVRNVYRNLKARTPSMPAFANQQPPDSLGEPARSAPWRKTVGGLWEEIGPLQLEFMISQGLRPQHLLLDVGCGSLRAGVHFVRYLHNGHYYGMDAQQWLIDAGVRVELADACLGHRRLHLLCRDDFDFAEFRASFDYAIAQSVFTHLPWNSILRCLHNMRKVLRPEGRFFATFFEDPDGNHQAESITHMPGGVVTHPDKNPFHYPFDVFTDLGRRTGLSVRYIGEWNHPRNQKMMLFTVAR